MKSNVLADALKTHGDFTGKGGVLQAGDSEVSLYLGLGNSLLTIERVMEVAIGDDSVTIQTRSDVYVFALEDVRGVRVGKSAHRAGFPT